MTTIHKSESVAALQIRADRLKVRWENAVRRGLGKQAVKFAREHARISGAIRALTSPSTAEPEAEDS